MYVCIAMMDSFDFNSCNKLITARSGIIKGGEMYKKKQKNMYRFNHL